MQANITSGMYRAHSWQALVETDQTHGGRSLPTPCNRHSDKLNGSRKKKQFTATAVAQDVYVMGGQIWGENGAMGQGQNDQCAPLPPPCPVIAAISVCTPIELFVLLAKN